MSAADRSAEQIRADLERQRGELATSIVRLRSEITELSDWRSPLRRNLKPVAIGAGVAGFVLAGGVGAVVGLLRRG